MVFTLAQFEMEVVGRRSERLTNVIPNTSRAPSLDYLNKNDSPFVAIMYSFM